MRYFAKLTKQPEGGYCVSFPDLDGCLTEGDTLAEALDNAAEALNLWLESVCDPDYTFTLPTAKRRRGKNYYPIEVEPQLARAIVLKQLRESCDLQLADAAKAVGMRIDEYASFEQPLPTKVRANRSRVADPRSKRVLAKKRGWVG